MIPVTTVTGGLVRSFLFLSLLKIGFQYPDFTGDFYLTGNVAFPPGTVKSEENFLVRSLVPSEEIPCKAGVLQHWPDGSILSAELTFSANSSQKREYVIFYGADVRRRKKLAQLAVLPAAAFSVGGVPKSTERLDVNVGQINVRVDRSPGVRYYWYILPIVAILILMVVRSRRTI